MIGEAQIQHLLTELPPDAMKRSRKVSCHTVFRFGNNSTVTCSYAYLVPLADWYVKICVVPSQTPFLISNNVFRKLGAVIDTEHATIHFAKLGISMPLQETRTKENCGRNLLFVHCPKKWTLLESGALYDKH